MVSHKKIEKKNYFCDEYVPHFLDSVMKQVRRYPLSITVPIWRLRFQVLFTYQKARPFIIEKLYNFFDNKQPRILGAIQIIRDNFFSLF